MSTVEELVYGEVARVQDALVVAGDRMRRHVTPESFRSVVGGAQRSVAACQEALAVLSVALTDLEPDPANDQKGGPASVLA